MFSLLMLLCGAVLIPSAATASDSGDDVARLLLSACRNATEHNGSVPGTVGALFAAACDAVGATGKGMGGSRALVTGSTSPFRALAEETVAWETVNSRLCEVGCDFSEDDGAMRCRGLVGESTSFVSDSETHVDCAGALSTLISCCITKVEIHAHASGVRQATLPLMLEVADWPRLQALVFYGPIPWAAALTVAEAASPNVTRLAIGSKQHEAPIEESLLARLAKLTQLTHLNLSHSALYDTPTAVLTKLTRLESLALDWNNIYDIEPEDLAQLTLLESLSLSYNWLSALDDAVFSQQTRLRSLDLSWNTISMLPDSLLKTATSLETLDVSWNALATMPNLELSALANLTVFWANGNQLTEVPPGFFNGNVMLTDIALYSNRLVSLPGNLLAPLPRLASLSVANNGITEVPMGLFAKQTALTMLHMGMNHITALEAAVFSACTSLRRLQFNGNRITALPPSLFSGLSALQELLFDHNPIRQLSVGLFSGLSSLSSLYFISTEVTALPVGLFAPLCNLTVLSFYNSSVATLDDDAFDELPRLAWVDIGHNGITSLPAGLLSDVPLLAGLETSGNGLTAIPAGFFRKTTNLKYLDMSDNRLTSLDDGVFDTLTQLTVLSVGGNNITSHSSLSNILAHLTNLRTLNVSYNTGLDLYGCRLWYSLKTIDFSGTSIAPDPDMCANNATVVARSLINATARDVQSLAQLCLTHVQLLDLSNNDFLNNLTFVSTALSGFSVALPISHDDTDGNQHTPALQMDSSPVYCSLKKSNVWRKTPVSIIGNTTENRVVSPRPALTYVCRCSHEYEEKEPGICTRIPPFWSAVRLVLLVVGTVSGTILAVFGLLVLQRRQRRMKVHMDLQRGLLEESQDEVLALKRAWSIEEEHITLQKRIDTGTEGAFGEVWRGQWDGIDVAVKVLRRALLEMDESVKDEFEKEIDFMQRTRHGNIVRFFGAGVFRDQTPFLVEELMEEGSLKGYLRHPKNQGLAWGRKIGFARDVARGIGHIHSLGHLHRDLKSGNVLVTRRLQCKVADFGSIGRLLCHQCGTSSLMKQERPVDTLAAAVDSCSGELTVGVGTPLYMSIEILRGCDYGQPTDVWSFGVLLWEIATQASPDLLAQEGKLGGRGPLLGRLLGLLEQGCRLRLEGACPHPAYSELMERCWSSEPGARPQFSSVLGVLDDLVASAGADSRGSSARGGGVLPV